MVKFHAALIAGAVSAFKVGLDVKHSLYSVSAGNALCDVDDKVCKLDKLNKYLGHIVVESHNCALCKNACLNSHSACVNEPDNGKVDDNVGQRVHKSGYLSYKLL